MNSNKDFFLRFDTAGRVRWHTQDDERYITLVVPEPPVPAALVRGFILSHPEEGRDIGEMSDAEAFAYSVVNDNAADSAADPAPYGGLLTDEDPLAKARQNPFAFQRDDEGAFVGADVLEGFRQNPFASGE